MSKFEPVAVPFKMLGNQRALTRLQIEDDPYLAEFVTRFKHCFEQNPYLDVLVYKEQDDEPNSFPQPNSRAPSASSRR